MALPALRRFLLFALLSLLTRGLCLALGVIDIDEACHAVGSWELLRGKLLYRDFVDNKPPLLYVYYAAAQLLLGHGLFAVRLLTLVLTLPLTALAASALFRHDRTGLVAGTLFLVYGAAFIGHDVLSVNAELLLLLPASWAVVALRDEARARRPLVLGVAGLLLGIAFLVKFHAAAWLPALAVASWRARRGTREAPGPALLALLVGFALPLAATWVVFARLGAGGELVYWTLRGNAAYLANPIDIEEALGRAAASVLPFMLATAPLWYCAWRSLREEPDAYRRGLQAWLLLLSLVASGAGWRFFAHYLVPVYWPLAIAAAPFAAPLLFPLRRGGKWLAIHALAMLVGFSVATAALYSGRFRVYRETDPVFKRMAERLRADPCAAGASLFVWGYAPIFYYETGLPPASRFAVLSQAGLTGYVSGNLRSLEARGPSAPGVVPAHWDWLLSDLDRSRATYVLDTAPAALWRWDHYPVADFPRLAHHLREHYELLGDVDHVRIFRIKGCAPPP